MLVKTSEDNSDEAVASPTLPTFPPTWKPAEAYA